MMHKHYGWQRGFSLIELMIVVAIIAILTAIAVPTYLRYVLHGRRAEAYSLLEQDQAMLERCYAQNFSYTPAAPAVCPAPATTSQNGYYALAAAPATAISAGGYVLTAVASGPQAQDTPCASFSITSANVRAAKTSAGADNTSVCWAR
jgi:type IV pilus assembly protein PilE